MDIQEGDSPNKFNKNSFNNENDIEVLDVEIENLESQFNENESQNTLLTCIERQNSELR